MLKIFVSLSLKAFSSSPLSVMSTFECLFCNRNIKEKSKRSASSWSNSNIMKNNNKTEFQNDAIKSKCWDDYVLDALSSNKLFSSSSINIPLFY